MHRSPAEQAEFIKRVEARGGTAVMIVGAVATRKCTLPVWLLATEPDVLAAINERFEYLESQRDEARAELAKLQGTSRRSRKSAFNMAGEPGK